MNMQYIPRPKERFVVISHPTFYMVMDTRTHTRRFTTRYKTSAYHVKNRLNRTGK